MPDPSSFTVTTEFSGKTVLAVLRTAIPGESWSKLRQRLQRSRVSINGVLCIDEARRVDDGDVVALHDRPIEIPQPQDVRIQFIDAHVVVVEKPSGMMTHRRPEELNWSDAKKALQ